MKNMTGAVQSMINKGFDKEAAIRIATDDFARHLHTFFDQIESEGIIGDAQIDITFSVKPNTKVKEEKRDSCTKCKDHNHTCCPDFKSRLNDEDDVASIIALLGYLSLLDELNLRPEHQSTPHDKCHCKNIDTHDVSKKENGKKTQITREQFYRGIYSILENENITPSEVTLEKYTNILVDLITLCDGMISLDKEMRTVFANRYECSEDNIYRSFKRFLDKGIVWKLSGENEVSKFVINPYILEQIKEQAREQAISE